MSTIAAAPAGRPTSLATLSAFALPGLPLAAMVLVYAVYLPRFYVGLGNGLGAVAGAVAAVRFLDVWLDPFLGLAMDRTRTPIGRYRPWLIGGAPMAMLGTYMLLDPAGHVGTGYLILWMLVTYAGLSMLNLSMAAWAAALAATYDERSRVYGLTQGLAVIGSTALLLLPLLTRGTVTLGNAASMPAVSMILLTAIPIAVLACAVLTPDRARAPSRRGGFNIRDLWFAACKPSMLRIVVADLLLALAPGTGAPLYVYFFHDAKGFNIAEVGFLLIFYVGAGVAGAPIWGWVARRIGKHRALQFACVCYGVTQTILMATPRVWPGHHFFPDAIPTACGMVGVGICASAFLLLIRAMVADVVDEVRLETGRDLTSLMFSLVTSTTKVGTVVPVVIVFPILSMVGYNGGDGAVNTPHALFGLEMCYLIAPTIMVFLGGSMFFGYTLDAKRHGSIREALERRDAELTMAAADQSLIGVS